MGTEHSADLEGPRRGGSLLAAMRARGTFAGAGPSSTVAATSANASPLHAAMRDHGTFVGAAASPAVAAALPNATLVPKVVVTAERGRVLGRRGSREGESSRRSESSVASDPSTGHEMCGPSERVDDSVMPESSGEEHLSDSCTSDVFVQPSEPHLAQPFAAANEEDEDEEVEAEEEDTQLEERETSEERGRRGEAALLRAKQLYKELMAERDEHDKQEKEEHVSAPEVSSQNTRPVACDDELPKAVDETVRRGIIVRLHGLVSTPHLNGQVGLVLYAGKEDRWAVHLDCEEPGCFRNVREQNLRFVCHGGAVQPKAPEPEHVESPVSSGMQQPEQLEAQGVPAEPAIRSPILAGKRKHGSRDPEEELQKTLAEQFAEIERELHEEENTRKRRMLGENDSDDTAKQGPDCLVEDILEMPQGELLKRLMAASTDDLAKVVSPEATAYVVLARSYRTRSSGA